ncbi:cytoplasmic tRNA 2-thiolation protein 1 [Lathyrus oleraceus]|uniref:cytoplasmic tRNA 2-thiolation protein 1 n=1 Tax=Pisum sativum TaxID=3888 RepID=UPI0021D3E480|nr:cytoplasmic tRNA 2-thiolation protein 1-like [Pisum sativum]
MEGKRNVRICCLCNERRASLKRPKTLQQICTECFYLAFENEIHQIILSNRLFSRGDRVAIGASGGKDSTVLAYVLSKLNRVHDYGLHLFLLSVDEGITGYRDDSLETVHRNQIQYGLPLKIVSYKDLYGWTMDEIVKLIGLKNNCTFCGVFRRQALDRGAAFLKVDKLVTGHNADDIAETILLNILRGDIARLSRCSSIVTGEDGPIPRCKPFKYTYEKEIVMYAYFKKLDYFSTECIYSPNAYRGFAREFIKDLERIRPRAILDIIKSGENFRISTTTKMHEQGTCERCGYISSQVFSTSPLLSHMVEY